MTTRYEEIPGANHFTVIAGLTEPQNLMTRRIAALAGARSHHAWGSIQTRESFGARDADLLRRDQMQARQDL
ncbi:hypothetical protein [Bosea thiooxidans]